MRWVGFPDGLGWTGEGMADWLHAVDGDPNRHHFVIEDAELGFCGEAYYLVEPARRRAMLDIKLRPEAQGRGIASRALSSLIETVFDREPSVDAVWTEPARRNRRARRLYRGCGLRPRRRPSDLPPWESYWERRR